MVKVYLTLLCRAQPGRTSWSHHTLGPPSSFGSVLLYCFTFMWFWKPTPVEGLNSLLFWSCSEWEAPGMGLLTSPLAEHFSLRLPWDERVSFETASCWEEGSGWYVCIRTWQQLRLLLLLSTDYHLVLSLIWWLEKLPDRPDKSKYVVRVN